MKLTTEQIKELVKVANPAFTRRDDLGGLDELYTCGSYLSLIIYDYEMGEDYENAKLVRGAIKMKIRPILYNKVEPTFENSHNWGYPMLCQAFALIKNKATLWNLFHADEQARITCLMEMFVHMWNFGCNQYNNYKTGIGLHGDYQKNANPNYMFVNEALILYCVHFFGSMHEVCQVMIHNPYELVIEKLKKYGFNRALNIWTTPGFELPDGTMSAGAKELFGNRTTRRYTPQYWCYAYIKDRDGNIEEAGRGKGCTLPYYYHERNFDNKDFESYPHEIYIDILTKCFNGGICHDNISIDTEEDFMTYIKDNTISPYLGQEGMMWEFNSWDYMGTRSSLMHCEIDFYLTAAMVTTLELLGINVLENSGLKDKVLVGMADCLYKMEHGYVGYSLGKIEENSWVTPLPTWI